MQASWWGGLVPVHWWAELFQGVSLAGSYGFMKTLGSLSADGWCHVLTLLVVWSEVSQSWSLQVAQYSQNLVRKWQVPRGLTQMSTP